MSYLMAVHEDFALARPGAAQVTTHIHDLVAAIIGASRDGADIATDRGVRAAAAHKMTTQGFCESAIEHAAGRTNEGLAGQIFLVAGLFADHARCCCPHRERLALRTCTMGGACMPLLPPAIGRASRSQRSYSSRCFVGSDAVELAAPSNRFLSDRQLKQGARHVEPVTKRLRNEYYC
jgi:hypothetical protein